MPVARAAAAAVHRPCCAQGLHGGLQASSHPDAFVSSREGVVVLAWVEFEDFNHSTHTQPTFIIHFLKERKRKEKKKKHTQT